MTTPTMLIPPSVMALNQLLGERRAPDRRLRSALLASYVVHAVVLTLLVTGLRSRGYLEFGAPPVSTGILAVTPLYSPGAPPGRRPVAVPAPRPEPPPPEVNPEPRQETRREVVPPDTGADLLREARSRPAPKTTPTVRPPPRTAVTRAPPAATPEAAAPPGGGTLASTSGPPGSPTGTLSGDADGGLTALLFTNKWYAAVIRDIVYSNWGDPFYGQDRPPGEFLVLVRFEIERDGRIRAAAVEKPSGNLAWDRSSLRAVENARLPPLPQDYPGARLIVHYEFRTDQR